MTRFCWVGEFERLDLVLKDVGKCEEAIFFTQDGSHFLDCRTVLLYSEDLGQPLVDTLWVAKVIRVFAGGVLAESKMTVTDVFVVIVIERSGTYVFILEGQLVNM